MILVVREYGQDCPNQIPEITLAFEDDGPLGRKSKMYCSKCISIGANNTMTAAWLR
jgi:hypothetical protein